MQVCVELAVRVGRRIAAELDLPVYLYGEAARSARAPPPAGHPPGRIRALARATWPAIRRWRPISVQRASGQPARPRSARVRPLIAYNVTLATG